MVSKQFSFRLSDEVVEWLEGLQLEGESLNQTARRILTKSANLSTDSLSTSVDIKSLVKQEVEASLTEVRSQLETQLEARLEELRGKLKAR
ncbi:MAG: hypothetical protein RM368_38115 [Nostoc sp. DedSLP03]|uniref:hypothetical protein n=1 Tax=Nostoc sp. DedSLP03 TaxID=3075400 RepID=UPI002AD2E7D5|nr:hypothetical protein [Nostoc sp. DedSLP03]MDZ7970678.1 hypothetical protein [Nostoc sp. DedSLP03]